MSRKKQAKAGPLNGPSQRQLRVAEQVRHELSKSLQRGHFQNQLLLDKSNMITVTEVRISPDLKNAKAYVMPLGGLQNDIETLLPALNEEAKSFQADLAHALEIKFTPRLRFIVDDSFGEAERIETILYKINKKKAENSETLQDEDNASQIETETS